MNIFARERLKGFIAQRPLSEEHIVDYYNSDQYELTVVLDDGREYIYDALTKDVRLKVRWRATYDDADGVEWGEEKWNLYFVRQLDKVIKIKSLSYEYIAGQAGISGTQLSNYLRFENTPGIYEVYRLAYVLECTMSCLLTIGMKYRPIDSHAYLMLSKDEFRDIFSNRLRMTMRKYSVRQTELARRLGTYQTRISCYVNGINLPNAYLVARFAYAIGCPVSELVDF